MDDTDIRVCRHHHLLVRTGKNTKKLYCSLSCSVLRVWFDFRNIKQLSYMYCLQGLLNPFWTEVTNNPDWKKKLQQSILQQFIQNIDPTCLTYDYLSCTTCWVLATFIFSLSMCCLFCRAPLFKESKKETSEATLNRED